MADIFDQVYTGILRTDEAVKVAVVFNDRSLSGWEIEQNAPLLEEFARATVPGAAAAVSQKMWTYLIKAGFKYGHRIHVKVDPIDPHSSFAEKRLSFYVREIVVE